MFGGLRSVARRGYGKLSRLGGPEQPPPRCPPWNPRNKVTEVTARIADSPFDLTPETMGSALEFFHRNGYLHIHNAVPLEHCQGVVSGIMDFLGMNLDQPETWYRDNLPPNGMVELYQHPSMWKVRESPQIHRISAAIYGTEKLWTSIDRLNFKVPVDERHPQHDSPAFIHWDMDSSNIPNQRFLQGVLMLVDTDETMGGFQCVPGMYGEWLQNWIRSQPSDRDPFFPDLNALPQGKEVTVVRARAGDYIIWDSTLAHGSGRNLSNKPRFAQYVAQTLIPTGAEYERQLKERITAYQDRTCLPFEHHFGDQRGWERASYPPPQLTEHGQKLLGLLEW